MAKKNYVVKRAGTYGKVGKVIERDFGKKGLTERQDVMLELYEKPVIKVDNTEELDLLQAENEKLKAELAEALKPKEEVNTESDKKDESKKEK